MPRLLIAEDNQDFARVLRDVAESCGWSVSVFYDGSQLLAGLEALSVPALLLVDINMPNVDGIGVASALSSPDFPRGLRIRFMTGVSDTHAVAAKMIAQARDHFPGQTLYKPIELDTLRGVLDEEAARLTGEPDTSNPSG